MPSERELLHQIETQAAILSQAAAQAPELHQRLLQQATSTHDLQIASAELAYRQMTADALVAFQQRVQQAGRSAETRQYAAEAAYQQAVTQAQAVYEAAISAVAQGLTEVTSDPLLADWQRETWETWLPYMQGVGPSQRAWRPSGQAPHITRIGQLVERGRWHYLRLPATLPIIGHRGLLMKAGGVAQDSGAGAIQSLLLRLLAAIPPAKLILTFIDPIGLGQNAAGFMHIKDHDEALVTGKAWTEPVHIEQQLAALTGHMENMIQSYLRNQYETIEDYNAKAGEIAEPYRLLAVFDFPANFSEAAARRLLSIAHNGPRCGVYTVILADAGKPMPHGFNLADLEQLCTVISWETDHWVWQDPDFRDCQLELDQPPEPNLFNRIVNAVGVAAKEAGGVEVPFERIAPAQADWWQSDSTSQLSAALGPSGARKILQLELGKGTAQHVLVAGKTGSGKSTLLHTLITSLALAYSPAEIELYLIDFKKGVEFKTYAAHQLPHARVIAIESEREFGLSVLQGLDAELKRRGDLFRGVGVDSLADYRARATHTSAPPRSLLLVDEFQEFFTQDDAIASQASQILDRLVRQGRAFGLHVLLGSQTLAGAYSLAHSTIDQMAVRIALQCSEADSRLILADDNPAARLLSRPGEAIYNAANGLVEGNNRFQVAWLDDLERDRYLEQLQTLAQKQDYRPPRPQIVFEGNAPAAIAKNERLVDLLQATDWPPPARRVEAWLGEPIAIKDPTAAFFRRQSGSNLLMIGQQEEEALAMTASLLLSLAAQHTPLPVKIEQGGRGDAGFYVLDFSPVDAPYADLLQRLGQTLPHTTHIGRRRQLPDFIAGLAAEVGRRLADGEEAAVQPALYLLIYGMQRARDLRPDETMAFSSNLPGDEAAPPNPAQQLATILRKGPELGVHAVVWCDTYTNASRALDRGGLHEFEMRVAMQMSAEDSLHLIDSPAASKLGQYRALFASAEEGRLEKFRPYGLPGDEWLAWAAACLRRGQVQ